MKNMFAFIIAVVIGLVSIFSGFASAAACEMMQSKFIVFSGVAISETEIIDKNTGFIYSGFENLEKFALYRCPAWITDSGYEIIDCDTWVNYLNDITYYEHDLTRVELCRALNNNDVVCSDGNIYSVCDGLMKTGQLYYVFFDKCNTDDNIYDDCIIEILDCSVYDVELYELNNMYILENTVNE